MAKSDYKDFFKKRKINIKGNVHGTGCVFSSAIAAFLCLDNDVETAIGLAEDFFNQKFQSYIELPQDGKVVDLTIPEDELEVINQIKEIYNYISSIKKFSECILIGSRAR